MRQDEVRASTTSVARLARAGIAIAGALIASAALAASATAADAIYWGVNNNPNYNIAKANVDGSGLNASFFNVGSTIGGLGYNGSSIFWAGPNGVDKANIDGSGSSTRIYSGPVSPGISIDSQYFYVGGTSNNVVRGALDGSATDTSFISSPSLSASYTAVNATHVYFAGAGGSGPAIARANIDGTGPNASFITGLSSSINGIAVDSSHIYWTYSSGTTIGRANLDGTGVDQNFITGLTQARAVAVDAAHIYWYSTATGNIARANLDGTGINTSFISGASVAGSTVYGLAVAPGGAATVKYALSVTKVGTGTGTVSSSPGGVECGSACSAEYDSGTSVTLTAAPASGSTFAGWGGACSGAEATCTVTMSEARSVTATFDVVPPTPSNDFKLSAASTAGRSIRTRITVPDPGRISQRGTRAARSSSVRAAAVVCSTSRTASKAGAYTLTCKVNAATRKAQKKGKVRVLLRTTFTPTGGTARTVIRTVTLQSLKPRYTG